MATDPSTTAAGTAPNAGMLSQWYSDYMSKAPTAAQSQAATWTPDANSTVQGQLTGILKDGSPLQDFAKAQSQQQMNARGLLNSSIANTAGQSAVIQSALPIATTDANISATSQAQNAGAQNSAGQFNANAANQAAAAQAQAGVTGAQQEKQLASQQTLQTGQQQFLADQAQKDRTQQTDIQKSAIDAQAAQLVQQNANILAQMGYQNQLAVAQVPSNFAATISSNTMTQINAILADPNLSATADSADGSSPKSRAVQNVVNYANSTLAWAEAFYKTPMQRIKTPGGSTSGASGSGTSGGSSGSLIGSVRDIVGPAIGGASGGSNSSGVAQPVIPPKPTGNFLSPAVQEWNRLYGPSAAVKP
jgi:hypothetical protein